MDISLQDLFKPGRKGCGFTDLVRRIRSEDEAIDLFSQLDILPLKKARCSCGNRFLLKQKNKSSKAGFRWKCTSKTCGLRFNPLENTWFERSHLNYLQNFELIVHWFYRMPFALTMMDTKLPEHTIVDWESFCREVCQVVLRRRKRKIGGPGKWVEVDEAYMFKRKYRRGHRIAGEHVWIFGGICRETKERFIVRVPNRKKMTLWPILKKNVACGSILVTDDFKSYKGGIDKALGFSAHETVTHKYNFVNPLFPEVFTNGTECMWSKFKKFVKRAGSDECIDQYIAEFIHRRDLDNQYGKYNFGEQFLQFFNDIRKCYPGPNKS